MQVENLGQLMKQGMRTLASGVCVLSAKLNNAERFAMTVSSVTSVSDSPASLLVCINQQVSQATALSTPGTEFAVNVLADTQAAVSDLCAGRYPERDRFSEGDWQNLGDTPILNGALATFLCVVDQTMTYGTHFVVVARITQVLVEDSAGQPLLYGQGQYGTIAPLTGQ